MSSTPPSHAPSTPSPKSTPPALNPASALASAARTVYNTSTHSSSSPSPSASKAPEESPEKEKDKHHHHHMHRHHHHRESKSARDGLLQSTTFGELLSPVKNVAGDLAGRRGGQGDGWGGRKGAGGGAGQGHVRSGAEDEGRGKVEWADVRRIRGPRAVAEA